MVDEAVVKQRICGLVSKAIFLADFIPLKISFKAGERVYYNIDLLGEGTRGSEDLFKIKILIEENWSYLNNGLP